MSPTAFAILVFIVGALLRFIYKNLGHSGRRAPPGPIGLPIIGHLHMLGKLPHRTLYKLSQKYGPIMSIRLGLVPTIIVSSPAAAELFLKTHDKVFASRPKSQAAHYLSYGTKGIAFTEYGTYWRSVKKFCSMELLNVAKVDSMSGFRREELGLLVESLKNAARMSEIVDVTDKVARLIEDMTCRMLFGKSRDDRFDLDEIIHELAKLLGTVNIAECIPVLGVLDLQGLTRRLKVTSKAIDKILEIIIDDHERDARNDHIKLYRDFVDVLLALKNNPTGPPHEQLAQSIDRSNIKAIMLDVIFGSIDTSQTAIEWIMSELIRHQRVMKLVQEEIRNVVADSEYVKESQLPKLHYLDLVVKESMRLHPVAPLLVPRVSMEDIVINGYYIQKNSRLLVNSWGIGRDPKIWSENVEEFVPERFIGSDIEFQGKSFELTPFGSGRRGCPGIYLGLINIKLVVAQLVHSFDWELPFGMSADELDMDENFGLSMARANHLLAIPNFRQS